MWKAFPLPNSISFGRSVRAPPTRDRRLCCPRYEDNFLSEQFPGNDGGTEFELELIYYPTANVTPGDVESLKVPSNDLVVGYDFSNRGDDKENYRWVNLIKNNRAADDYSDMIAFNKTLSLSGAGPYGVAPGHGRR